MQRIKFVIISGLSFSFPALAFEVNTHQALTRCAITTECGQEGASNLTKFVKNSELSKKKGYIDLPFEGYSLFTYKNYIKAGEKGISNYTKTITDDYKGMIEAGVILEDANWPHADNIAFGGDGRYNNHFYFAQDETKSKCLFNAFMLSQKALCVGYGKRTDSVTWALDNRVTLGLTGGYTTDIDVNSTPVVDRTPRKNNYALEDAFRYFQESFTGGTDESGHLGRSQEARKKSQAKLFFSIGTMVHLLQDIHSPAHVRNGSHPLGDYLEIYGRYNNGFNITQDGDIDEANNNKHIIDAIKAINMKKTMLNENQYASYTDFFLKEASWISSNFFSGAHHDKLSPEVNIETGIGLDIDTITDGSTIFDGGNSHLAISETVFDPIPPIGTPHIDGGHVFSYIKTKGDVSGENRNLAGTTLAISQKSYIKNMLFNGLGQQVGETIVETDAVNKMLAKTNFDDNTAPKTVPSVFSNYDATPLENTAINVMPRAVASSEAFINYFFRGQMKATPIMTASNGASKLIGIKIDNISDPELVSNSNLLTFKSGGQFKVLYIEAGDTTETTLELATLPLTTDLPAGSSIELGSLPEATNMGKIIVLFDGQIGEGTEVDTYGIGNQGARGLSVAMAEIKAPENTPTQITANKEKTVMSFAGGKVCANNKSGIFSTVGLLSAPVAMLAQGNEANHIQLLTTNGTLFGMGENGSNQVSDTGLFVTAFQAPNSNAYQVLSQCASGVPSPTQWKQVGVGRFSTMAVDTNGDVWGWGGRASSRLGVFSTTNLPMKCPLKIDSLLGKNFKTVNTEYSHGVGVTDLGDVYTWGAIAHGQLGYTPPVGSNSTVLPKKIDITGVVKAEIGAEFTIALKTDGTVWSWGYDAQGQLGDGDGDSTGTAIRPVSFPMNDKGTADTSDDIPLVIKDIAVGQFHALALDVNGKVWAWGAGTNGQNGTNINQFAPQRVTSGSLTDQVISQIFAGATHSLAVNQQGALYGWGNNATGQLGLRQNSDATVPEKMDISACTL